MDYEQLLEHGKTAPRMLVCPTCEGNCHQGICGQWRWVKASRWVGDDWCTDEEERFIPCEQCNGKGKVTPRQFDCIND
jgi:RecJ-like exonuclease